MKILFLTNNNISLNLFKWLKDKEDQVILYKNKLSLKLIKDIMPDFLISYNYRYIIGKDIIKYMDKNIINLHISYLPWNKGAYPNIWSFIENTPKGVTIHIIDEGIDTGDILVQKLILINEDKHTLKSSYLLLHKEIQNLFKENWEKLKNKKIIPKPQKEKGSIHYIKDFEIIKPLIEQNGWDMPIEKFKNNQYSMDKIIYKNR